MPRLTETQHVDRLVMAMMSSVFPAAERAFLQPNTSCCVISDVACVVRRGLDADVEHRSVTASALMSVDAAQSAMSPADSCVRLGD